MSPESFKHLIMPLKDRMYRLALRITGETAEAEDALQEVWIKLWKQGDQLLQIQNLEAWCVRVTKNHCIDKVRNKKHEVREWTEAVEVVSWDQDPERKAEQQDTFRLIRRAISRLPEKLQLVMHLRDIEGLSYQEIEEALEMPMAQVKVNLFRARQQVRAQLLNTGLQ